MTSPGSSSERPQRGFWRSFLLFVVWVVAGLFALAGLAFLGCTGVCG